MSVKKQEYLFLSAALRAREARMLTGERASRMIDAASFEEAAKLLTDCGYEDMSQYSAKEIDAALSKKRSELFSELERTVPDADILGVFRMKYDYHNAKAVLKADAMGVDASHLLSDTGRYPAKELAEMIREERLSDLPEAFSKAIGEAAEVLARTFNPQLSDFILDRAYFKELSDSAAELNSDFLSGYARILIDTANLKSAVRTLRMGKSGDFLKNALIPGGSVPEDRVAASLNGDGLDKLYSATPLEQAASLGVSAAAGGGMTAFELACDNAVGAYTAKAKRVAYGEEPLIGYLAAVESEITAVRMILTGRLAGVEPETIRERMRELYA